MCVLRAGHTSSKGLCYSQPAKKPAGSGSRRKGPPLQKAAFFVSVHARVAAEIGRNAHTSITDDVPAAKSRHLRAASPVASLGMQSSVGHGPRWRVNGAACVWRQDATALFVPWVSQMFPLTCKERFERGANTPKVDHVRPETGAGGGNAAWPNLRARSNSLLARIGSVPCGSAMDA